MEISTKAIEYVNESLLGRLVESTVLGSDFEMMEQKMKGIAESLDRCAHYESTKMSQEEHRRTQRMLEPLAGFFNAAQIKKQRRDAQRARLLDTLGIDQDNTISAWTRLLGKGSSFWLSSLGNFREWRESSSCHMLWLSGNLGAGKSVTLASAIGALKRDERKSSHVL